MTSDTPIEDKLKKSLSRIKDICYQAGYDALKPVGMGVTSEEMMEACVKEYKQIKAERRAAVEEALNEVANGFRLVAQKDEYEDSSGNVSPAPSGLWRTDALKVIEIVRAKYKAQPEKEA